MDYKKKYEDALNRAKKLQANAKGLILNKWLYSIFPELKESEDEQMTNFISHELACLRASDEKGSDRYKELTEAIAWLKTQREQKPADKVEPKFHQGEWITNGDYTWKIIEVKPLDYILQSQDGNIVDDTTSHVDEQFHSFTIQDAKDGDVLVTPNNNIFIFKEIRNLYQIFDHCGLYFDSLTVESSCVNGIFSKELPNDYKLATKEQRDLLFQKMKEAGYKWDAEKKELKKIKYKPAWSEEDEKFLNLSLVNLTELKDRFGEKYGKVGDCIDWLKSLKERMKGE